MAYSKGGEFVLGKEEDLNLRALRRERLSLNDDLLHRVPSRPMPGDSLLIEENQYAIEERRETADTPSL